MSWIHASLHFLWNCLHFSWGIPKPVWLAIVGISVGFIGIEMANNPPTSRGKKWAYRIIFICLGMAVCGLTYFQDKDQKRSEQDNADKISGLKEQVSGLREQLTNTVFSIPALEVWVNDTRIPDIFPLDSDLVTTNTKIVNLEGIREVRLGIMNKGEITAERVMVELYMPTATTNLVFITPGWEQQVGPHYTQGDKSYVMNGWLHAVTISERSVAGITGVFDSRFLLSTNLPHGKIPAIIDVHADKSKHHRTSVILDF